MYRLFLSMIIFSIFICSGCSKGLNNPTSTPLNDSVNLPEMHFNTTSEDRTFLGMWDAEFDLENLTVELVPNRDVNAHFNVTLIIPGPQIDIINFNGQTGMVEVDITIDNPSAINAFDLRFIVMTDTVGHMLQDPDNWTDLYDQPGGLPVNPFIAYAKGETNRLFAGPSQHMENMTIFLPALNPNVTFAIDASVPGNCTEPYKIDSFVQYESLTPSTSSSTTLDVTVHDWQDNINSVHIYCPSITGVQLYPFAVDGVNPNLFHAVLTNTMGAGIGQYDAFILSFSSDSGGLALYEAVKIVIEEEAPLVPTFQWGTHFGGIENEYFGNMTVDNSGNILVVGQFEEISDFDPSPAVYPLTSNGEYDAFVAKYSSTGNFIWAKSWGGEYDETADGIIIDDSGNIYISGYYAGIVDFNPGSGQNMSSSIDDSYDGYLLKLDVNGNFIWVKSWGGDYTETAENMDVDSSGNLLICGVFGSTCDFNPGPGIVNRTAGGNFDMYLLKLDSNGIFDWVQTWGAAGGGFEVAMDLGVDSAGGVFVTGYFQSPCDFDPGTGDRTLTPIGWSDVFVTTYDINGQWMWAFSFGGEIDEQVRALTVDPSDNFLICGGFQGTVDFDPDSGEDIHPGDLGEQDIFLSKYGPDGNYLWTVSWGGDSYDTAVTVTTDNAGYIYMGGSYAGTADFDPGPGVDTRISDGYDMFITGYSPSGDYLWGFDFPGNGSGECDKVVTANGQMYAGADFSYSFDVNPGPPTQNLTSNGDHDITMVKFWID